MAHPKGVLIERLQKEGRQPRFESRISGPDHEPIFESDVMVDDEVLGRGTGPNKRTAERSAAEEALAALDAPQEKPSGRRRGKRSKAAPPPEVEPTAATSPAPAKPAAEPAMDDLEAGPFEGPWPVFETVLATALRVAHDRVAAGLATDEARASIETFALTLYKNMLQDLGEIVEEDVGD